MSATAFVNDARVMSKGQVTIPKNVRAALGINTGDRVTFIVGVPQRIKIPSDCRFTAN